MKRLVFSALVLIFLLCSCGKAPQGTAEPSPPASASVAVSPADRAEESFEPSRPPAQSGEPEETPAGDPSFSASPAGESPAASESPAQSQTPVQSPAAEAEAYGVKSADTVLTVTGGALSRDYYFTLAELQSAGGFVEADYFSRGREPQEETNRFCGVGVRHLLESVIGLSDYGKAVFTASDGYSVSFPRSGVNAAYLDETDPSQTLCMILAWSKDSAACPLTLVMGQSVEGEYNRMYWARDVVTLEVTP